MDKKYSTKEIRDAWHKWDEEEISEKQFLPYFIAIFDQHLWDLMAELIASCMMPHLAQAAFVKRNDADEIMHRYCMYAGHEGEEIDEGNGATFLKNKHIESQTIKEMIQRFPLTENDQMALFEVQAPRAKLYIGDYCRLYHSLWGLEGKARDKAVELGYIRN